MGLTLALQAPASSHFEGPATRIFRMSASQFTVLVYRLNDSSMAFDCQFKPRLYRHLTGKGWKKSKVPTMMTHPFIEFVSWGSFSWRCNQNDECNPYAEMRISLNNSVGLEMSRGFQRFNFFFILFPFLEAGGQWVELKRPYVRNELCIFDEMKLVKGKEMQEKKNHLPSRAPIRRSEW